MEEAQNVEWSKAQQINFSVNLVETAKQHLKFLAVVDRTGCLYDGPVLERAIQSCNISVIVSEEIFGQILDKMDVLSTVGENFSKPTELLWNKMYVSEPFYLDPDSVLSQALLNEVDAKTQRSSEYDLVAAVKRQSSFFSKVSKVIGYDDCFLEEAVARYKSFLYMSKIIMERKIDPFCVPTHDIDLIWHTHQLYPAAYCKDLTEIFGKVLDHNDRDFGSLGSAKNNLELMFLRTKEIWENTYGCMYCMEGAKQHKSKDDFVGCCMDHVPGISEKHVVCIAACFILCRVDPTKD